MLALAFFQWWYSRGWLQAARHISGRIKGVLLSFSVATLMRTLFAPWKQIVAIKDPNETLQMRVRGFFDTLVSRFIGFCVRTITLLTALVMTLVMAAFGAVLIALWPILPPAVLVLMAKGVGLW